MKMEDEPSTNLNTTLTFGLQKVFFFTSPLTPKTESTSDGGQESPIQVEISEKQLGYGYWLIQLK